MNRVEPNLLLAVATAFPFVLVLFSASVYGPEGSWLRYLIVAVLVIAAFLPLHALMNRKMGWERPPLIYPGAPSTVVWAGLFPLMIMILSAVPLFWPGRDLGLLIIIASLWFAVTLESAFKARRA